MRNCDLCHRPARYLIRVLCTTHRGMETHIVCPFHKERILQKTREKDAPHYSMQGGWI